MNKLVKTARAMYKDAICIVRVENNVSDEFGEKIIIVH